MELGESFIYVGGSFKLTQKNLNKAIKITEKALRRDEERLKLWKENPGHKSFAHDMKYHGANCIDNLLNNHVIFERRRIEKLKSLQPGGQMLMGFM